MDKEKCLVLLRGTKEVYSIPLEQIVLIEANEGWSKVYMAGNLCNLENPIDIPLLLKQIFYEIHLQIDGDNVFVRCGRSSVINLSYVRKIDGFRQTIHLSDGINYYNLKVPSAVCKELLILMKKRIKT